MTRVSFYVGQSSSLEGRLLLACRLVEKALAQDLQIYIHTDAPSTSLRLDELLWTYSELSFIPHALMPSQTTDLTKASPTQLNPDLKVWIGHGLEPAEPGEVLINLSNAVPDFFTRFERMLEVLDQESTILAAGRQRYQLYRNQGYTLDYHQL